MGCKVISHRGANLHAPQNTLPAFEKSLAIGVDGFETDIHCTLDGVPVVCHNYTIDETSDGKGSIADKTLEELKTYDFGSYFNEKFKGTQLPTLDEFLALCEGADIEIMNIEIKAPKVEGTEIVRKCIEAVKAHGLFDKLLISSFSPEILVEAKQLDPEVQTGLLYDPIHCVNKRALTSPAKYAKEIGCDALHPHYSVVTKCYVRRAHENGIKVNPWTVDSPATIKQMLECGVDAIITNTPETVKAMIASFEG